MATEGSVARAGPGRSLPAPEESARRAARLARYAAIAAVVVVGAAIAWQIVANTLADESVHVDPERALALRPDSAAALSALATNDLNAGSTGDDALQAISALAQRALVANPLDREGIRLLGLVADLKGDTARADQLMQLATSRSKRDSGAQLWLFDQRARAASFAEALQHIDVVLRTQPSMTDNVGPALIAVAADPAGKAAMLDMLARDPPWRAWFLRTLSNDPAGPPIAYDLLVGLAGTAVPPRPQELAPYIAALVDADNFDLAFLSWLRFLPADQAKNVPFAYNGDFEQPISGLAFDWTFSNVRGAVTEVVNTPDRGGKALRVVFSNTRVAYRHAAKLLVLPPGTYELDGVAKAQGLITARGMRWRVYCAEGDGQKLIETDAFAGTFDWRSFSATFTVPSDGCRAQWLRLELDARVAPEQQVVGTFWSDGLTVTRLAASSDGT